MIRIAVGLALLGATAYAAPAADRDMGNDAKLQKRLAGRVAGAPQDCIEPSLSQGAQYFGSTVLLKDRAGVIYRTQFADGCVVSDWDIQVSRRPSTRLCRGDIIEVRDRTSSISRGACTYTDFVPYRRP